MRTTMAETAVGIAIIWLVITIRGRRYQVNGLLSILFMLFIAYGLGTLVMLPFGK